MGENRHGGAGAPAQRGGGTGNHRYCDCAYLLGVRCRTTISFVGVFGEPDSYGLLAVGQPEKSPELYWSQAEP